MRRSRAALLLSVVFTVVLIVAGAPAAQADEPLILDARESRVVADAGVTAAYTLDANVAEAVVRGGTATLIARNAGATELVVVRGQNVRTVSVIVRTKRATTIATQNAAERGGNGGSVATH